MTLEAEVRLIRWAESSTAGRTITIELPPGDGEVHPFRGFPTGHAHGQRFKMSFVPIDDDETETPDPVADVKLRSPDSPPQDHANSFNPIDALFRRLRAIEKGVKPYSIPARERYRNSSAAQRAIARACLLPKDERFREWAKAADENEAVEFIRNTIGGSRSLIGQVYEFYTRYIKMENSYLMACGQMAEPR